jgi:hypothetical protein
MLTTTQLINSSDSFFSYEPIRFNKNQKKKSPDELKKIYENKIARAENALFNSRDLLSTKITKTQFSLNHIQDKITNLKGENIFQETVLYGKLASLKVQLFRLQSRFEFLNNNQDIIPFLSEQI